MLIQYHYEMRAVNGAAVQIKGKRLDIIHQCFQLNTVYVQHNIALADYRNDTIAICKLKHTVI